MRSRTFSLAAYLASVATGMVTTTGILMSSGGLNPGALGLLLAIILIIPAAVAFLPATLFFFYIADRLGWRSLWHHALFGAAVSVCTTLAIMNRTGFAGGSNS